MLFNDYFMIIAVLWEAGHLVESHAHCCPTRITITLDATPLPKMI
jgi:hypothetical protein